MIEQKNVLKELPDKTKLYSIDEFKNLLKRSPQNKILVRDAILMLLAARNRKPIYGRTMLMKQIFLLYEEILKKYGLKFQDPKFVPYRYGPYSFAVMQVLEDLDFAGYIKIEGRKNSRKERFMLTEKGLSEIINKFRTLDDKVQREIEEKRIGWDQLGTNGILRYVYQNYPKFKEKSELKEKYKEIEWGKGKA
ncbi:MAG: hypothetical protein H0Z28_08290 [Archaeoglobus sp.]|nr:hypothetical protein [Archaeoglobus sp.]